MEKWAGPLSNREAEIDLSPQGERRLERLGWASLRICSGAMLDRPSRWQILQSNTASRPESLSRFRYSPEKLGMML